MYRIMRKDTQKMRDTGFGMMKTEDGGKMDTLRILIGSSVVSMLIGLVFLLTGLFMVECCDCKFGKIAGKLIGSIGVLFEILALLAFGGFIIIIAGS